LVKPKTRVCSTCKARRLITEYHFENKKKGTRRKSCKYCRREYLRSLYKRKTIDAGLKKQCRTCKEVLAVTQFTIDSRAKDGLSYRCRECHIEYQKKYRQSDQGKKTRRRLKRVYNKKYRSTPNGKIRMAVSSSVAHALKKNGGSKEGDSVFKYLPYAPQELRDHLEKQFTKGMTWKKYGINGWHIDHIVAHSNFHYSSMKDPEFLLCWSLVNLRPIWAEENLKKGTLSRKEYKERRDGRNEKIGLRL